MIQTSWGEGHEIGVSANFIIIKLKNGEIKFIEGSKIVKNGDSYKYENK